MNQQTVQTTTEIGTELAEVVMNDIRDEIARIANNGSDFVTNSQLSQVIYMLQEVRRIAKSF